MDVRALSNGSFSTSEPRSVRVVSGQPQMQSQVTQRTANMVWPVMEKTKRPRLKSVWRHVMSRTFRRSGRIWKVSRAITRLNVSGRGGRAQRGRRGRCEKRWLGTQEVATSRRVATSDGENVVGGKERRRGSKLAWPNWWWATASSSG